MQADTDRIRQLQADFRAERLVKDCGKIVTSSTKEDQKTEQELYRIGLIRHLHAIPTGIFTVYCVLIRLANTVAKPLGAPLLQNKGLESHEKIFKPEG